MTVDRGRTVGDRRMGGGRPAIAVTVVALVVGALIGALIGAIIGQSRPSSYHSTASISVQPDVALATDLTQSSGTPSQDATDFIQTELLVLNGPQFARSVQHALSLSTLPSLSSTQVGQTYAIDVTGTAATRTRAEAITQQAVVTFSRQYRGQLLGDYDRALKAVGRQIANVRAELANRNASSGSTAVITREYSALAAEYERLLAVNSTLLLGREQSSSSVNTVQPPAFSNAGLSTTEKLALAGGVIGAFLSLALILLIRQLVPRIGGPADANELGIPVLLPEIGRERGGLRPGNALSLRSHSGRLLAARAVAHHRPGDGPLVVIGSEHGVGTTFVATYAANELSSWGPVILVLVPGGQSARHLQRQLGVSLDAPTVAKTVAVGQALDLDSLAVPTHVPGVLAVVCGAVSDLPMLERLAGEGGFASLLSGADRVVVDAPPLGVSGIGLMISGSAGSALVVCARSSSRREALISAVEIVEVSPTPLVGVVLNNPRRSRQPRRTRSRNVAVAAASPTQTRDAPGAADSGMVASSAPVRAGGVSALRSRKARRGGPPPTPNAAS